MGLSVAQRSSYTYYKYSAVFAGEDGFAFARSFVGVKTGQLFGMDKSDVRREDGGDMRKFLVDCLFDFKKGFVYGSYGLFQLSLIPYLGPP